jgi:hypothetical protein
MAENLWENGCKIIVNSRRIRRKNNELFCGYIKESPREKNEIGIPASMLLPVPSPTFSVFTWSCLKESPRHTEELSGNSRIHTAPSSHSHIITMFSPGFDVYLLVRTIPMEFPRPCCSQFPLPHSQFLRGTYSTKGVLEW